MNYQPIENYSIIGNLETVALVGMDGSIDFFCFPDFDSPTIFASLLDHDKGGSFKIAPVLNNVRCKQLYLPDTNVLMTRFLSSEGVAEIIDFMPIKKLSGRHALIRRVKTVRGTVRFGMLCDPRFDYARAKQKTTLNKFGATFKSSGKDKTTVNLRSNAEMTIVDGSAVSFFKLSAGDSKDFILELGNTQDSDTDLSELCESEFHNTVKYWRNWADRSNYSGRWREMINRSALTLKLLTSNTHGSVVAAATFGLPEEIGGERNWDYRFTWIRDSSLTLNALLHLGYNEAASGFMHWIEARCNELNDDGSLQIMYRPDGSKEMKEIELSHFEGYRKSKPVRIGNGASDQLQLDIYGELMDAIYLFDKQVKPVHHDLWVNLVKLVNWVCKHWESKDEGIWEVRGGRQEFLYSRLMCWVAIDRAVRLAWKRSLPAPLDDWLRCRNSIYNDIYDNFWNSDKQAFVQHKNTTSLDAACLVMPLVGFIGPTDPRWISTLDAVERELTDDSLVYRYKNEEAASDGLSGDEGTFSICSFWFVECLSKAGRLDDARLYFEKMLGYANHTGLYSEELGPSGEHLGNFPQAFTHLALISAACDLNSRL